MAEAFDAKAYARTFDKDAIDALVFIINSNKKSVSEARGRAARTILELGHGLHNGTLDVLGLGLTLTK